MRISRYVLCGPDIPRIKALESRPMNHPNVREFRFRLAVLGLATLGCLWAPLGCYQKVVRAEGFGSDRVDVYEPDAPTDEEIQAKKDAGRTRIPRPPKPPKYTY